MEILIIIATLIPLIRVVFVLQRFLLWTFATHDYLEMKHNLLDRQDYQRVATRCHMMYFQWHKIFYLWEWGEFDAFVYCELDSKILLWEITEYWNDKHNQL